MVYAYDAKRRLTEETSSRLGGYDFDNTFDGAGNETLFRDDPHTYNADNQLTGPGTDAYDGNGNPTTWAGTTLAWNVENRMTAYGTALTAGYRGDGLRAWKDDGTDRTYFLYDGISVLCELDAGGAVVASSAYGANGLLSRGAVQYQFNLLGDAVLLLDGSGTVTATPVYDAWGNALTATAGPHGYRARYGYYTDGETGWVALAYRYYAPGVGRFLNRDPIGTRGGTGVYLYVRSNANNDIDANGLGQAMCHPRKGSPPYSHCYLLFERPCDGYMGWGFYQKPEEERSSGKRRGEGEIRPEENVPAPGDKPMGDLIDASQGHVDDQALCNCVRESRRCKHRYELRAYNCVHWANEMLDCAAEG